MLPELDYDGIENSLDQWQTYFMPCQRGVKHIRRAVKQGRRGADLVPALLKDARTWMFADPTMCADILTLIDMFLNHELVVL